MLTSLFSKCFTPLVSFTGSYTEDEPILNHPGSFTVYIISLVFFYLCKVLFSGFVQFNGNFVDGQNN